LSKKFIAFETRPEFGCYAAVRGHAPRRHAPRRSLPLDETVASTTAPALRSVLGMRLPAPVPQRGSHRGERVVLRPLDAAGDAGPLHEAGRDPGIWTYLPYGPFQDETELAALLRELEASEDPLFFTIATLPDERPSGVASYLRITPEHGVIEIGHIWFGTRLQRTAAATEAIYLLARHAFEDLGYRRLEWKCNAANAASRRAAERFGFTFEGVFRKHMVVKGRNRDSAWYSIVDDEWPAISEAFRVWLDPENFDEAGSQRRRLAQLRA
jgi:RimJ/RimL family protein N-acetyltransferase